MSALKPFLKAVSALLGLAVLGPMYIEAANESGRGVERSEPLAVKDSVTQKWVDMNNDGIRTPSEVQYFVEGEVSGIEYRCSGTTYNVDKLSPVSQQIFRAAVGVWVKAGADVMIVSSPSRADVDVRTSTKLLDGSLFPKKYLAATYHRESVIVINSARKLTVNTAIHEMGHTLGLGHSSGTDIMSSSSSSKVRPSVEPEVKARMLRLKALCPTRSFLKASLSGGKLN